MKPQCSQRLLLRTFTVADINPHYVGALNDWSVVGRTEARHRSWDLESVQSYVDNATKLNESQLIGLFLRDTEEHIGNVRLSSFNNRHVELGIMIHAKQHWGKGFAAEALGEIDRYVFDVLSLHKICADYHADNFASATIFRKAGYVIEGVFKDHFYVRDRFVDSVRIARFTHQYVR